MTQNQIDFLNLFFNEGEEISVSDSKFSFHSVTRQEIESGTVILKSPPSEKYPNGTSRKVSSDKITLACMNPVKGWKRDENITAYRSFLIELDGMPLKDQYEYVMSKKMPFSICVFSGNKSFHFGIVMDRDFPNYETWYMVCRWIFNIMEKADQQNISPSRGFRFPDNVRPDGQNLKQGLASIHRRISQDELYAWLSQHLDKQPEPPKKETYDEDYVGVGGSIPSLQSIPRWVHETLVKLQSGEQEYRNKTWFNLACFMANKGIIKEDAILFFEDFFIETKDFDRKEWLTAITSGFKHVKSKGS